MEVFVMNVKGLAETLLHRQSNDNVNDVIEKLFAQVLSLEQPEKIQDSQVEEIAIQLWNWAVTKNVGSAINEQQKARVRHVACRLLYLCEPVSPSENAIRKQILMASKTGRTWLDCKHPELADDFLSRAVNSLETLYCKLTSQGDGDADNNIPKGDVEKDLLRVLSYQAESAVAQDNHQEAVSCMQRCKEILLRLPKETGYLSLICYNFGVDTYNKKKHEESSFWLSQSYDIGRMNVQFSPGQDMQAKVLRLLATVYMELDCHKYQDKALHAVSLANKESPHQAGFYLKIRIMLKTRKPDEAVRSGLTELLDSQVPLHVCLSTAKLLMAEDREALAFEFLKKVSERFQRSPELGDVLLLHIRMLLQSGRELLGQQKVEDAITGHYTGSQLSPQTLISFHLLLWDKASKNFEAKNYSEALQWYNYSLSFYKAGNVDTNLAKLQRNRASCFLHLQQLDKAKEAISEAARCDPDSLFTQFSIYKIAVLENDVEKAADAVRRMGVLVQTPVSSEDRLLLREHAAVNVLSLAAQIALENEQQETAVKALESLCEHSQDVTQVLRALRCLVRLVLSVMDNNSEENRDVHLDVLLSYLKRALQTLSQQNSVPGQVCAGYSEEASWFRRIAWNTALQCHSSTVRMKELLILCYQLSLSCVPDKGVLMGQKTCLLMAAAACLDLSRKSPESEQQTEILTQALEHIQICWDIWKTLKASDDYSRDPTDILLLLYEFEARAKLSDPKLECVLESVLQLHNLDTKLLETIAALAMEPPAHFPVLCKKALRVALTLHKRNSPADWSRCILIQLSLPSGVCEVEPRVLEEVWGYYEEALSIIAAAPADVPEVEMLWLLTRAWNTGILLYSLAQYPEAERWCSLAMSFLRYLGSLQDSYQTQMSALYSEVLDRLDKAKMNLSMEE
ncbi:testis-expressed protein 11 isoform X2 [Brachyhypopomus gauderio]|uniref:testis-expressed protein 11 isoform X2 n=1 Tax=Brachyhypopomus gauderio TaxID=698409 RepID=UPI004042993C